MSRRLLNGGSPFRNGKDPQGDVAKPLSASQLRSRFQVRGETDIVFCTTPALASAFLKGMVKRKASRALTDVAA